MWPNPGVGGCPSPEVTPSWHCSGSPTVALGLPASSKKDASFFASCHSRGLASAAVFISGSHYGEIQPFISSGKRQRLGGCRGRHDPRVTLSSNSSLTPDGWCSAPSSWAIRPSIRKESKDSSGIHQGPGSRLT